MIPFLKSLYRMLPGRRARARKIMQRCASLRTQSTPKGDVLIAYILDPFLRKKSEPISYGHTHHFESLLIARTFLDLGYNVDVIDYENKYFRPEKPYAFFVSARTFLELVSARLNKDCTIIAHLDTSHFLFNNLAAYRRAMALRKRRGIACPSIRLIEHNRAIERAQYGIVLGNEVTMNTYRYAGRKLYPLPVPSPLNFPFPEKDYSECRKHFLWFGSSGMVHKGLDIVLEAFCKMPDLHLYICGPVNEDKGFCDAFQKELFHTPNVHTIGWIDINSAEFQDIIRKAVALVYPSCAEGQAGSVVVCLHAGIIPLLSKESGLSVKDFGVIFRNCSIDEICKQITRIASLPNGELEQMTRSAWEYARAFHTESNYSAVYQSILKDIMRDKNNSAD